MANKTAPGERKRKATIVLPSRTKKTRTADEDDGQFKASDEEDFSDNFDNEDGNDGLTDSGATTPMSNPPPKTNPNWPSVQKTIPCPFPNCDRVFNRKMKLDDHIRSHNNDRSFVCTEDGCGKSFLRKTHLNRHIKSAHTEERNYACSFDGCDKAFTTGTRLRRHEAQHIARSEHKCNTCGQEFRKLATLQRHIDSEHMGQKPFLCQHVLEDGTVCGAGFDRAPALKTHESRAHNEKRYWCDVCLSVNGSSAADGVSHAEEHSTDSLGFTSYAEYQAHIREVHPPTCDECGEPCSTSRQLTRHMELQHGIVPVKENTVKPTHVCPEPGCGRTFSKKGNLDVHVGSVHAKQRPFVCGSVELMRLNNVDKWDGHDACGKDFKAKSQLEEHIRTAHLGLQNRMKLRKQAKAEKNKSAVIPTAIDPKSTLGLITGTTEILCEITGCATKFSTDYDYHVHLQVRHGFDTSANFEEPPFGFVPDNGDPSFDHDLELELEVNAHAGGPFWLGDSDLKQSRVEEKQGGLDSFGDTEAEMSRLVGTGNGWEDDIVMDPALLDA